MRTMRATLVTATLLTALAGSTAHADYHPACIGIVTGKDAISVTASASGITYGGSVTCPGAQKIDVGVTLTSERVHAAIAGCANVATCLNTVSAGATIPLEDGTYRLRMVFHVESIGAALVYDPTPRCGVWTVTGTTATGPTACV